MTLGKLLASGRDADVFAIDGQRVLRRYRHAQDATAEATVMAYVHRLGFPAPRVYEADGGDLVMEQVDGRTLSQALTTGHIAPADAGAILADLHTRLHALPPRLSPEAGVRLRHLDLHPDNVILSRRGPVLIDWTNADEGPPDLDRALSAVILAEAATGSYVPPELASAAGEVLRGFLVHAGGDLMAQLQPAVARRKRDPNLGPVEKERLDTAAALVTATVTAVAR